MNKLTKSEAYNALKNYTGKTCKFYYHINDNRFCAVGILLEELRKKNPGFTWADNHLLEGPNTQIVDPRNSDNTAQALGFENTVKCREFITKWDALDYSLSILAEEYFA